MLKKIGDYYLNMPIREVLDLRELTQEEYKEFETAGVARVFSDERIYQGRDVDFAGAIWKAFIGSTEGMIYRIALQAICPDANSANDVFAFANSYLLKEMGELDMKHPAKEGFWYYPEGNVILEQVCYEHKHIVQMCLTSSIIKHQAREMVNSLFALTKRYRVLNA